MVGAGLAFSLIPVLAQVYRDDREALEKAVGRYSGFFNSHPYLATVAIAALARLEVEKTAVEEIDRFKSVVSGPLGTLGDRLVWARWRPLCSFLAIFIFAAGAPWWLAVAAFLIPYNALHLALRLWGLRIGWREGLNVGRVLISSTLRRLPERLTIPLAAISGAVLPPIALAAGGGTEAGSFSLIAIAIPLAVVGIWRPVPAGRTAAVALVLGALAFAALGNTIW